jgi:hypothetical protein
LRSGVFGADVEVIARPPRRAARASRSVGLGHVEQNHLGAIAGQGFGDGCADPGRPGDQRLAPGQWAGPVGDRRGAVRRITCPEMKALFGEEKPQRAFQLIFGAFADIEQLQRAAVAQLLGQRALKPFEGRWALAAKVAQGFRARPRITRCALWSRFFSSGWKNSRSC